MTKTFTYGGIEWLVLEESESSVLVLAKESIGDMPYDEGKSNNWTTGTLRKHLDDKFLKQLKKNGADLSMILDSVSDLTSDDGLDDYGTCTDKVTLLTCDQYRKHRRSIPNLNNWWWLLAPYSTESNGYSHYVRHVNSDGSEDCYYAYDGRLGVRPALNLNPVILESPKDRLIGYSTEELLKEVLRRNAESNQSD